MTGALSRNFVQARTNVSAKKTMKGKVRIVALFEPMPMIETRKSASELILTTARMSPVMLGSGIPPWPARNSVGEKDAISAESVTR